MTTKRALVLMFFVALFGVFGSCGDKKSEGETQPSSVTTESRRDSALAASKLPGAQAVGRAMALSDSAKARAKRIDDDQP